MLACGNVANEFETKKKQKLTEIINTVKIHPAAGMLFIIPFEPLLLK